MLCLSFYPISHIIVSFIFFYVVANNKIFLHYGRNINEASNFGKPYGS